MLGRVGHPSRSLFRWGCAALASDDSAHGLGLIRRIGSHGVGDRTTTQEQEVDEEIGVTWSSSTSFVVSERSAMLSSSSQARWPVRVPISRVRC